MRAPGVTASLLIVVAANTVGWSAHMTYMYYLAPIALRAGGLGGDAVVFSLVAVAMGVTVLPAGLLADRVPRRYVIRAALALLGLAYAGVALPPARWAIVAGTLSSGVGLGFLFVSFHSYVADLLEAEHRATAFGRAGALAVLATAIGPALAALVLRASPTDLVGLRWNALLFGAASAATIALTLRLPSVRAPAHAPHERGRWHEAPRAAAPVALLYLFMGAGYGMTAPYFTVYFLDHVGMPNQTWGYLLAAGTVASAVGSLAAGELNRSADARRIAVLGMLGLVGASLVFVFPVGVLGLALGFLGRSFFSMTAAPGVSAAMMRRAHVARRAQTQAYGSLAWNLGWALGGATGGMLLASMGGALFPLGGSLALVGVVLGVAWLGRERASA